MIGAQLQDLLAGQRQDREQAVLPAQRLEVDRTGAARFGQLGANLVHARAHHVQLVQPQLGHGGVFQNQTHRSRAVIGRHRPGRAGQRMAVRQHRVQLRRIGNHRVNRAHAVAVHAKVLVAAIGDQRFRHGGQHAAHAIGVFFHALAQPLIGQIEHRQHAARRDQGSDFVPVGVRVIDPGRVVAAAMQQHRVLRASLGQRTAQRVHIDDAGLGRVVEGLQFQPQIGKDLRVVRPAGRAHPDPLHPGLLGQRHGQPHAAGAAGGLHPVDPPVHRRIGRAEHVRHQRVDKAHVAFRPQIGFGILRFEQLRLSRLDRGEHRGRPRIGAIDAHAQVDLVGPRVGVVELDQREQRIGGLLCKIGQHGAALCNRSAAGATLFAFISTCAC